MTSGQKTLGSVLVGIVIEHWESQRVIVATDIMFAIEMIRCGF